MPRLTEQQFPIQYNGTVSAELMQEMKTPISTK
jgi:hypothetical protein